MEKKLPENWVETTFTDVLDINGGTQPPKSQFVNEPQVGYIRLLQIRDFGDKPVPTYIPDTGNLRKCLDDDILIARYGASIGRIVTGQQGAYNVALAKVKIPESIDKRFIMWLLKSHIFQNVITSFQRTAQSGFNKNDLDGIRIPLAPLPEQERIVDKLDSLFAHVGEVKTRLEKVPELIKQFRQSVLTQAVTGKLTEEWREGNQLLFPDISEIRSIKEEFNKERGFKKEKPLGEITKEDSFYNVPDSWTRIKLGETTRLINGDRGKNYPNREEYVNEGLPFINTGHIESDGSLDLETMNYITRTKFDTLGSGKIEGGDLVYCLRGATLGKTAFVAPFEEGAIASSLVIIRPVTHISESFIYYFLTSPIGRSFIKIYDNGTAQPNLSAESVRNYAVGLPSIEEQTEIVRRVENLFAKADNIEAKYERLKKQIDNLPQALLAKAFKGELVEQLPTDGDARELLEEVKKLKEETKKKK